MPIYILSAVPKVGNRHPRGSTAIQLGTGHRKNILNIVNRKCRERIRLQGRAILSDVKGEAQRTWWDW